MHRCMCESCATHAQQDIAFELYSLTIKILIGVLYLYCWDNFSFDHGSYQIIICIYQYVFIRRYQTLIILLLNNMCKSIYS